MNPAKGGVAREVSEGIPGFMVKTDHYWSKTTFKRKNGTN